MAFTQNGTTFSSVKTVGVRMDQWPVYLKEQQGPDSDGGVINAVDIDWNKANVNGATPVTSLPTALETTGQLLATIKWLGNRCASLESRVSALENQTPSTPTLSSIKWASTTGSSTQNSAVTTSTITNKITATFSDSSTQSVDETSFSVYEDLSYSPMASGVTTWTPSVAKNYYIKGHYDGKTTTNAITWTVNAAKTLTKIEVSGGKLANNSIQIGATTTWTKGTVTATYSDGTTANVTSSTTVTLTSSSSNCTVSGTTIRGVAASGATITATYSYTYNGVTKTKVVTEVCTVTAAPSYYFYVGTTKPTSLSQASTVSSYPAEQTYTNNSGAKSHIFVLTNNNKTVVFINPELNAPVDQVAVDTTTVSGYKIWETAVGTANGKSVKIQIS